ncbi:MAG: ATP-dependent helicase, partial [Comamonas sp.]|nr:ATP-dependent helicase [Comamonas sp.]
ERRDDNRGERSFDRGNDRGGERGGFGGDRGGFGAPRREGGDFARKSFGGRDAGHGAREGGREGGFRGGEARGFGGGDRRPAFGKTAGKPYQPHGERGGERSFERKPRAPRRDER